MSDRVLRVGAVSFLNTVPLVEGLADEPRIEVAADLPSAVARGLADGRFDVALIPAVEYLRGLGRELVPGICIGARGAVHTVKIFSQVPLAEIERVSVDRGSRTSVALMQVLLGELHGIRPPTEEFEPRAETLFDRAHAALVIGDRVDTIDPAGLHVTDLGALWNEFTGLPFVFAAWVLADAPFDPDDRQRLVEALQAARERGTARFDELARREAPAHGREPADLARYWRENIHYDLGARELEGMRRFADLARQHGQIARPRVVEVASA